MKAAEFDRRFDDGEDMSEHVDWSAATRPNRDTRRVNVELPVRLLEELDLQAQRLGVTRQALIERWISERLS
ncbi:type II toxin-antitoxin system BrnA family antitoxin [Aureimonas phyllosphaerae]|uniref:Uncharacterized protein n=1 Tax=Aureimonas phyllosphaerae TaxID=1166078 RepID=A0A7W6FU65_9HYPH|nr:CopG family antitoxin [Aureimonas phyllosphaerae]MBB3935763.1 hypothetical protein [Aureimonas phyllosphaerae]MBB3959771.1 hypothetical protein [Aureimonas phyllosphaerae]SFF14837.1 CopG antitoxin of type II toxin-antitoxin system [Aureimonas phyllosphaerae]